MAPPDWPPPTGVSVVASQANMVESSVVLSSGSGTSNLGSVMGGPSAFLFGILP